jgi:hypothetical protein
LIVSRLLCDSPLYVTPIVAVEIDETADVVTWKAAVFSPPATDRTGVTCTEGLSLETDSAAPEDGAGPVNVAVAVDGDPPVTAGGESVKELGARGVPGGSTVKIALCVCPLYVAITFTGAMKLIGDVGTANVAVVAPGCTVTELGTCATA